MVAKNNHQPNKPSPPSSQVKNPPASEALIIVGLGASAGGLEALRAFVAELPLHANMAYVVAQHMSPQHRSMMADLLSRETKLVVLEAKDGVTPNPDTVYIGPPNGDIFIKDGKLALRKPLSEIGPKPSVDYLFTSMAEELGEGAIGVVLSGTGSDGAHGVRAINAAGGICIAQSPDSAKYDSMPQAAIKAGVDLVLAPAEIAAQLVNVAKRPRLSVSEKLEPDGKDESADPLKTVMRKIYERSKMDFSNYKEATLTRQIERRMAALQTNRLPDYLSVISDTPTELDVLATSFLVCVTSFFRDAEAFKKFTLALQKLMEKKQPGEDIRIWVPGCATGEEAYSIAIILAEILGAKLDDHKVQIFATDINKDATSFGRKAIYPETSLEGMDKTLLQKYFRAKDRLFLVDRKIRDMVVFANHDLIQDPPFVRMDVITCRNLLIYFKTGLQEKVFRLFHYALNPSGLLFLGSSESVGQASHYFDETDRKYKLFQRRDVPSTMPQGFVTTPLLSLSSQRQSEQKSKAQSPESLGRDLLLSAYAPPSVLMLADGNILELFGDVTPFIALKSGKADFNLFAIIHPKLRTELRAIAQKVTRSHEATITHPVQITINNEERAVHTMVRPIQNKANQGNAVLVSFEVARTRGPVNLNPESVEEVAESRISELTHELTLTRESLQTVIEELETSNEELQSLNEEAQAANEELQASNEELETSNEELQATNEELTTVNDELSARTIEIINTSNDLENVLNCSGIAVLVIDRDLRIRRFNQDSLNFFKIDEALLIQNLASVPTKFAFEDLIGKIRKLPFITTSINAQTNSKVRHFLGKFSHNQRDFELNAFAYITRESNTVDGLVLTVTDITSHVQSERALMLSQVKLSNYMQLALGAAYWEFEAKTKQFIFNEEFFRVFNKQLVKNDDLYRLFGAISQKVGEFRMSLDRYLELFCHTDDRDMFIGVFEHALKSTVFSSTTQFEHRILTKQGEIGFIKLCFYVVDHGPEQSLRMYGVTQNITAQHNVMKDIELARKAAEDASLAKSKFLSSMSHELRTPLNAILGFGQILEMSKSLDEKQKGYVQQIMNGGNHLLQLINQVLELAKIEAGNLQLTIEPISTHKIVDSCSSMTSPLLKAKNINFQINDSLPKNATVMADQTRITQVLLNLLSNAIKYTPDGGKIRLDVLAPTDSMHRFVVTDSGIGIPAKYHEEVFTPFNRMGALEGAVEGTGIGLTITKDLVNKMSGSIGFVSEEGKGSSFWFELPAGPREKTLKISPGPQAGGDIQADLENLRGLVLYIEDNPSNVALMQASFAKIPNLELVVASSAKSGIEICIDRVPQLVLMDLHLPDMDGAEATRLIRAHLLTSHIPVIALSADVTDHGKKNVKSAGVTDYLSKPFQFADLVACLQRGLDQYN